MAAHPAEALTKPLEDIGVSGSTDGAELIFKQLESVANQACDELRELIT